MMTVLRRPRLPGFALLTSGGVLFVLIIVVALSAQAAPPPTVSELAPQAARQITEVAEELGGTAGSGSSGGEGTGGSGPGGEGAPPGEVEEPRPAASDAPIETERVRMCIGNPPRQIEDPQSPPCVPYWGGTDNGGATWKGVTATEIRVAVGNYIRWDDSAQASGDADEYEEVVQRYETFFNRRFEFYGRKLNLITYVPTRPASPAVNMRADAVKVDEELKAFAATQYTEQDGRHYVFFDALAQRQIMGVVTGSGGMSHTDEQHLAEHAPYQWDYAPTIDRMFAGYGEFICKVLAGERPAYAAPPESQEPERKFGIIVDTGFKDTPPADIGPLRAVMDECGARPVVVEWAQDGPTTPLLLDLKDQGVTSVMYTGQAGNLAIRFMNEAGSQGYHPEWLVWDLGFQDSDSAAIYYPKNQAPHIFGLQVFNKTLGLEDTPYVWASREVAPDAPPPQGDHYERLYKSLLLLASGIQMAGPELTPANFEEALMRTQFPNPGAAGPPYYQARVGFPGTHSMQQDMAMVWVGATERSPATDLSPSFCYVDLGRRYGLGQWPQEAEFFSGPCR